MGIVVKRASRTLQKKEGIVWLKVVQFWNGDRRSIAPAITFFKKQPQAYIEHAKSLGCTHWSREWQQVDEQVYQMCKEAVEP